MWRRGLSRSGAPADSQLGQSTVEYALLLFALVASIVALGALWHAGRDGTLLRLARDAASHALSGAGAIASAQDVLLF